MCRHSSDDGQDASPDSKQKQMRFEVAAPMCLGSAAAGVHSVAQQCRVMPTYPQTVPRAVLAYSATATPQQHRAAQALREARRRTFMELLGQAEQVAVAPRVVQPPQHVRRERVPRRRPVLGPERLHVAVQPRGRPWHGRRRGERQPQRLEVPRGDCTAGGGTARGRRRRCTGPEGAARCVRGGSTCCRLEGAGRGGAVVAECLADVEELRVAVVCVAQGLQLPAQGGGGQKGG